MMILAALIAVQLALATAKTTEIQARFSTQVGSAGVDPKQYNGEGDRRGAVFFDLTFPSRGVVSEWQFFATDLGDFYADVWAIDSVAGKATLMGSNKLTASVKGLQVFEIPPLDRIHVEAGYAIGIHYADESGDSVLSWEREPSTSGIIVSAFRLLDEYSVSLHVGAQVSTDPTGSASPALKAILIGPNPNLRLVPEEDYRVGRVEVKVNDVWGTVCDKWWDVKGWANLFCVEMGFPGSEYANYTMSDEVGLPGDWTRYQVPMNKWSSYPISMQSPRCKLSDNHEFMSCYIHPKGECTHRQDMYVECLPRMRCANNRTRSRDYKKHTIYTTSCVPEIYQDGSWGYVADTRPIGDMKNNNMTWLAAFCKEIGYTNVKRVNYAIEQLEPRFKPKHPVTYCNPTCSVSQPDRIGLCKPGPMSDGCQDVNKIFYITCERKDYTGYERPKRIKLTTIERKYRRQMRRQGVEVDRDEIINNRPKPEPEKAEKEERERAEREEREREERERAEREQREREEREAREREEREREERERRERELREGMTDEERRLNRGREGMTDEERRALRSSRRNN